MNDLEVIRLRLEDRFKVCPNCGNKDGFHTMIERKEGTDELKWLFICPECSKIYDIGHTVTIQ